jgi:hypothetical protein
MCPSLERASGSYAAAALLNSSRATLQFSGITLRLDADILISFPITPTPENY